MKHKIKPIYKTIALTALMSVAASFPLAQASDSTQTSNKNYILGTFFKSNEDINMQCYLSESTNGSLMKWRLESSDIKGRDISCQYYKGYFYICLVEPQTSENPFIENTFKLYRSRDFKEWEVVSFKVTDRGENYREVWAPDLFIDDKGDGKANGYVYFAKQKGKILKPYEDQFDLYVYKIENIAKIDKFVKVKKDEAIAVTATGKVDVTEKPIETIEGKAVPVFDYSINEKTNYIDAQVRKVNGKYYMVIKNEARATNNYNKSPLLFVSDSPDGNFKEVVDWPLKGIRGYEGFSILTRYNKVYFYADNFSLKYDNVGSSGCTVWSTNEKDIENGPYKARYVDAENFPLRHGSVINNLDEQAIKNLKIREFFNKKHEIQKANANKKQQSSKNNVDDKSITLNAEDFGENTNQKSIMIDNFAPALDVKYIVPKNKKEVIIKNIVNPYGVQEIKFEFAGNKTHLIVEGVDMTPAGKEKNKKITVSIDSDGKVTLVK